MSFEASSHARPLAYTQADLDIVTPASLTLQHPFIAPPPCICCVWYAQADLDIVTPASLTLQILCKLFAISSNFASPFIPPPPCTCCVWYAQADLDIVTPASLTLPTERLLSEAEAIKCITQVGSGHTHVQHVHL